MANGFTHAQTGVLGSSLFHTASYGFSWFYDSQWRRIPEILNTEDFTTFPPWFYFFPRNSRRCERSPSWSSPPTGIKPGLHEWHQLYQRLLHWTGVDSQDLPYGCHSQTSAASPLFNSSSQGQHSRGCRDLNWIRKVSRQVPSWRRWTWYSFAEVS